MAYLDTLETGKSWKKDSRRVLRVVELVQKFFRRGNAWQVLYVQGGGKRAFKEVLENFAFFDEVVAPLLANGGTLVDLCSGGTALLALMAFLWTNAMVYAVDIEKPSRKIRQYLGKRFEYLQKNLFSQEILQQLKEQTLQRPIVVVGVHCCGKLSFKVVEIGVKLGADYIAVVPCCVDRKAAEEVLTRPFDGYGDWLDAIKLQAPSDYLCKVIRVDAMPTNANVVLLFTRQESLNKQATRSKS